MTNEELALKNLSELEKTCKCQSCGKPSEEYIRAKAKQLCDLVEKQESGCYGCPCESFCNPRKNGFEEVLRSK